MLKAVIFDMDGLMFDTETLAKKAWIRVGELLGYPITEAHIAKIRGSTPTASAAIFREAFGDRFDYPRARAMRNDMVAGQIRSHGVPVKYGLEELLEGLKAQGLPAAVASGSPRRTVEEYLAMTGLSGCFACVIGAEDVTCSKPDPEPFLRAAEGLGIAPENCLVLEDSGNGLRAAYNAGMTSICIPDIALPDEKSLSLAAAVLPNLSLVSGWILEWNHREKPAWNQ